MSLPHIDFMHIAPHLSGQDEAFEELCCQNARHIVPAPLGEFVRYRGAGGDGGVECVWRLADGKEWGWQVKYIFNLPSALSDLSESIEVATRVHPQLERYTVCLPFDLTGPTGRKTRKGVPAQSQRDRFDEWRTAEEGKARAAGVNLTIQLETPSSILDALQSYDSDGGRLRFWFDATSFTEEWFAKHIAEIKELAGPRYTPELSLEVPAGQALEGLGQTDRWFDEAERHKRRLRKAWQEWKRSVGNSKAGGWDSPFPATLRGKGQAASDLLFGILEHLEVVATTRRVPIPEDLAPLVQDRALPAFRELRVELAGIIDAEHGEGMSESASFRQFQAEYQVSFPTANLDRAIEVLKALDQLAEWLGSTSSCVAGKEEALMVGEAGSGKTHALCDAAALRHERGLRTVVLFGERFSGAAEPWTQIRQHLGLPADISRDALLAAMDAAGEATGYPLLLLIDGLNETTPRNYWHSHLASVTAVARPYPFIKLCVSCRTTYLGEVVPHSGRGWQIIEHRGFKGMEFDACRAFFSFYGLEAPMVPLLQTEFSNPLFLRLICEAAQEAGYAQLPLGWQGIFAAVTALLTSKNRRFALQYGLMERHRVPEKGLQQFISAARSSYRSSLPFEEAASAIQSAVPVGATCGLLIDWLIAENLLIVDAQPDESKGAMEDYVRISFDRLGDHLLASKFLEGADAGSLLPMFASTGALAFTVQDEASIRSNRGLLEALSIQIPERFGRELPSVVDEAGVGPEVGLLTLEITVSSLLWRDGRHITDKTADVVWEALRDSATAETAFDALIEVAAQPSQIDAFYLDAILRSNPMPKRDGFWCPYLFESFERKGPMEKLIRAGLEMDIERLTAEVAMRWATALLWGCAAADRRVRDHATKALVRITERHPSLWEGLVRRFTDCDDEYVIERCLLCAYGALLRSRDIDAEKAVAQAAHDAVFQNLERFQNAAIRDHARSILELAAFDGALPDGVKEPSYLPPYKSEWPLAIPSEQDLEPFAKDQQAYPKLYSSCTFDDFFTYGLYRAGRYEHVLNRAEMGRWIFRHVLNMGYGQNNQAGYDSYMLGKFGGGRGKPAWAERIGKKYQWIALARLTARLSDNNEPEEDTWEPAPANVPLVYLRGRDIDPSLLLKGDAEGKDPNAWWQPVRYDHQRSSLDDREWLKDSSDIPDDAALISLSDPVGKKWLSLENHPRWAEKKAVEEDEDSLWSDRRDLWMQIRSYLVPEQDFDKCWAWLKKQHFMGRWMPEGAEFHEGFVGEYPWAVTFNTHPDSWSGRGGDGIGKGAPCTLTPTCNSLNSHDEYDAYQTSARTIHLPSRLFFEATQLRWDRGDGFIDSAGTCRFADPSFTQPGPSVLLVDPEFLRDFLENNKMRIIWTVLAEKLVLGNHASPRLEYSRVHTLSPNGFSSSRPNIKRSGFDDLPAEDD